LSLSFHTAIQQTEANYQCTYKGVGRRHANTRAPARTPPRFEKAFPSFTLSSPTTASRQKDDDERPSQITKSFLSSTSLSLLLSPLSVSFVCFFSFFFLSRSQKTLSLNFCKLHTTLHTHTVAFYSPFSFSCIGSGKRPSPAIHQMKRKQR